MNFAAMLADPDYLAACAKYRIDPLIGPVTSFQRINVTGEINKARGRVKIAWWLSVDWIDRGLPHSETEMLAFLRLYVLSLWAARDAQHPRNPALRQSNNHRKPLREVLLARGAHLEFIEDADGAGGVWVVVEAQPQPQFSESAAD